MRNKVSLIGHLGEKPTLSTTKTGKEYTKFSLATNETHRDEAGEKVTETSWHRIAVWGNLAKIATDYLDKGKEVAIEGKLNYYELDQEGETKYFTEIRATDLTLLGKSS